MTNQFASFGKIPLCLDGRMLGEGGTGVSTYAHNLRRTMQAMTDGAWTLEADRIGDCRLRRLLGAVRHRRHLVRAIRNLAGEGGRYVAHDVFRRAHVHFGLFGRPLAVTLPGPRGVMHWTYPVPLRVEGWANVYTVHDAIPLVSSGLSSIDPVRHCAVLAALAPYASRFVTVSAAAQAEIVAATGLDSGRVVDCGQAIDVIAADRRRLPPGLEADAYFLVCGSIEPRKNIERLISAYRTSGLTVPLVFAGPLGWKAAPIVSMIEATPGASHLGYQDRATMLALLASARALLLPSLHEGFGLPLAEAMALGTPVLTSRDGALAEVANMAALLVDPFDVPAMAAALRRLDRCGDVRAGMARRGRAQAGRFDIATFAARLAPVYRGALDGR